MSKQYNVNDHAQYIFETRLDDFFNHLATQCDLYDALWCMFDSAKEYKNAGITRQLLKYNRWKPHVFRLLDTGNDHAWLLLTTFAQSVHDDAMWDHVASKADDLR